MSEDDEIVVCYGGAVPTDGNFATVVAVDDEIVGFLERPLALTDWQLEQVLAAAASIPAEQRGAWLQAIANRLGCEPRDADLRRVLAQDDVRS